MTLVLISLALYVVATCMLAGALRVDPASPADGWRIPATLAMGLHASVHILAWHQRQGPDLHFFAALSLVGLGMAALTTFVARRERLAALGVFALPLAGGLMVAYRAHGPGPATPLDCSSPEAFVRSLWPHAKKTAEQLGVSAKALIAQAALETGWGRRLVGGDKGVVSHNLFGIKATGWKGAKVASGTHEYVGGVRVNMRDSFRAYASAADSFADYARLLGRERYAAARGTGDDVHRFASALQRGGYATDPSYANKITAIANGATMRRALAALERG